MGSKLIIPTPRVARVYHIWIYPFPHRTSEVGREKARPFLLLRMLKAKILYVLEKTK
jgi:hypothetical protein